MFWGKIWGKILNPGRVIHKLCDLRQVNEPLSFLTIKMKDENGAQLKGCQGFQGQEQDHSKCLGNGSYNFR